MFPILGSSVLFGLYMVFRYLDKDLVNLLLRSYFSIAGIAATTQMLTVFVNAVFKPKLQKYKLSLTAQKKPTPQEISGFTFTTVHAAMLGVSVIMTAVYLFTKQWFLSNIFGLAFSYSAVTLLGLDSFKTGGILLSGLFLYDIFWVFGTDVMVTVAKNFDAPIKIQWPKQLLFATADGPLQFTMLGLGDIVIPGIFVALALRYDLHRYHAKHPNTPYSRRLRTFPKPYFTTTLIAYVAGLATTISVMHTFKAAQPALLYLSPACLLAVAGVALVNGEVGDVLKYTEEQSEVNKDAKKVEEKEPFKIENSAMSTATDPVGADGLTKRK